MLPTRLPGPIRGAMALLAVAALVAACSSSGGPYGNNSSTQNVAGATQQAGGSATVTARTVGGQTILVAGSDGMTVYTFTKDTAGSGQTSCTGACAAKWPALTIPAGATPSGGSGVSGQLGTIKRSDDGAMQVTYNGLPLYFYSGDGAPGDTNGNYPNWNLVKP